MQRDLHRDKRQKVPVPIVSLVGYTNAGKSTLMNCLTDAGVLVEDKLFATLDPAVRRIRLPSGRHCLIADTVGFVHKLPHQLIEAFKATFREIDNASLLLHVIDTPEVRVAEQVETVDTVLQELGLSEKRTLRVFNKMDLMPQVPKWLQEKNSWIAISAAKEEGIEFLLDKIDAILASDLKRVTFFFPYRETRSLAELFAVGRVLKRQNVQEGIKVVAEVGDKFLGKYASYILDPAPST